MVWPIWVVQALWAIAAIVVGELLRPKPKIENPRPNSLGDFGFPTATEGRTIPAFWGTVKISGPNVVWYGDLRTEAMTKKQKSGLWSSKRVVTGYKYHLGVHHAFGFGQADEFLALILDDKNVTLNNKVVTTDLVTFDMDQPTLFGKVDQEGGVKGRVSIYMGTYTQGSNAYLEAKIGEELPAYRPIVQAVFEGCYLGNSGRLPKPEFIFRRCPNPLALAGGAHNIDGDANPANVIFEVMTNRIWGMGIPASLLDTASFVAVGNTLAAEGMGISMLVDNEQGGENLLSEIVRHIDGVVYNDYSTGKFKIALARDDYDVETLPVVDESVVLSGTFEFSRASWEDTQNTVKIKYLDRSQNYTERVVQHQNLANISVRGGAIEAEDYDYLAFTNATTANKVAARVLQTVSSPLSRINFEANRTVTPWIRPGAVFKMSWDELGIVQVVYRVTEVDYGTIDNPSIRVSAVEDIFSVASVAYATPNPSGWVNPIQPISALEAQDVFEAPYALCGNQRALLSVGARVGQALGYYLESDPSGGTSYIRVDEVQGFTSTAVLAAAYPASWAAMDTVGFTVSSVSGFSEVQDPDAEEISLGGLLLLIKSEAGEEWVSWGAVTENVDGTWTFKNVVRGVLDTVPLSHPAGARVWVVSHGASVSEEANFPAAGNVKSKLLPFDGRETLPAASAPVVTTLLRSRASRPYPPAKIRFNGAHPTTNLSGLVSVEWAHRNRLTQQSAVDQQADSVPPEAGTRYVVRIRTSAGALVVEKASINATTGSFTLALAGTYSIEIASHVGALESWAKQTFVFTYDPAGETVNAINADTSDDTYILDGGGA